MTPNQLATEFLISIPTLARWRMERTGPAFICVGRRIRYRRRDVEAWLTNRLQRTRQAKRKAVG
jgi:hypothetical protein